MRVSDYMAMAKNDLLQAYYTGNEITNPDCTQSWTLKELEQIKKALAALGYEYVHYLGND